MIEQAKLIGGELLEDSRLAPYGEGQICYIIDQEYLIIHDEVIDDFDLEYYKNIFEIIKTYN